MEINLKKKYCLILAVSILIIDYCAEKKPSQIYLEQKLFEHRGF